MIERSWPNCSHACSRRKVISFAYVRCDIVEQSSLSSGVMWSQHPITQSSCSRTCLISAVSSTASASLSLVLHSSCISPRVRREAMAISGEGRCRCASSLAISPDLQSCEIWRMRRSELRQFPFDDYSSSAHKPFGSSESQIIGTIAVLKSF
jgi:hypothetical protein